MPHTPAFLRHAIGFALLTALAVNGCSCDDEAEGLKNGADSTPNASDGASTMDGDGSSSGTDGSASGSDGSAQGGDGSAIEDGGPIGDGGLVDAENPLEEPLSDFCRGEGTVVTVGGAGECAGQIAQNTFQFALCACETISVQSTLEIDAFDSAQGTYGSTLAAGGQNILDDGHLGLNGALDMDGKLTVHGVAFVGGGGFAVGAESLVESTVYASGDAFQANSSTRLNRNAYFNGDVTGRFNIAGDLHVPVTATVAAETRSRVGGSIIRGPIPPVRPCPCDASEILDIGGLTTFGGTHNDNAANMVLTSTAWESGAGPNTITLPCGRYYVTRINHPGGLTVRAEGRTVLFVDGDMTIGGGLNLELAPGAEIDLFVAGTLSVGAAARLGDEDAPSKVRTYVGGAGTIDMSASSLFGGNLYAPRSDIIFGASATLFGALFAKTASFSGSADVHFDSAVRSAGATCVPPPAPNDGGLSDTGFDDAGNPIDAGNPDGADDAAVPPGDGGAAPDGAVTSDGGTPGDASPADGGQTSCTATCGQCGELACIIPEGQPSGVCDTCTEDIDCCAPMICVGGLCRFNF